MRSLPVYIRSGFEPASTHLQLFSGLSLSGGVMGSPVDKDL
jgi:hypothetical protein